MRLSLLLFFCCLFPISLAQAQTHTTPVTLSGYTREQGSQEVLPGVNVYVPGTSIGTTTNAYGFYSLTLPGQDSLRVAFSLVGYQTGFRTVFARKSQAIDIQLIPGQTLATVEVKASVLEERVSESVQMSSISVPVSQVKKIPALLGEKDVLKVLQLLPGVQKGSEGQTGLYVRGGWPRPKFGHFRRSSCLQR